MIIADENWRFALKLLRITLSVLTLVVASVVLVACSHSKSSVGAKKKSATAQSKQVIAIENAIIFDGNETIGKKTLLIRDGVITAIVESGAALPADAKRVDYSGHYIIPGLVNAHAHVGNTNGIEHGDQFYTRDIVMRDLHQFQAYGVTTVLALGMNGTAFYSIRDEVNNNPAMGAQLFGAGPGVGVVDGAPPAANMGLAHDPVQRPVTADDARSAVREQAEAGVDIIKLWVDDLGGKSPQMTPEVYTAAIAEAHRQGKHVVAHIHDLQPAMALVASDVNMLGHGVRDQPISSAQAKEMKRHGVGYIPTLHIDEANYFYAEHPELLQSEFVRRALPESVIAKWSDPAWQKDTLTNPSTQKSKNALAMNLRNLKTLHDQGVRIGFGTNAGALPHRVVGIAEHRELQLMIEAGLTPQQALHIATQQSAQLMALNDRGVLQPGKRADFVVLSANPLDNIANTQKITAVWQAGQQVAGPIESYRIE